MQTISGVHIHVQQCPWIQSREGAHVYMHAILDAVHATFKILVHVLQVQKHSKQLIEAASEGLKHLNPPAADAIHQQAGEWDLRTFMLTEASRMMHQAASAPQPLAPADLAAIICSLLTWPQSYHAVSFCAELANALAQRNDSSAACWLGVGQVQFFSSMSLFASGLLKSGWPLSSAKALSLILKACPQSCRQFCNKASWFMCASLPQPQLKPCIEESSPSLHSMITPHVILAQANRANADSSMMELLGITCRQSQSCC